MKIIVNIMEPNDYAKDYDISVLNDYIYLNIFREDNISIKDKLLKKDEILKSLKDYIENDFLDDENYTKKINKAINFITKNIDNIPSKVEAFKLQIEGDYRQYIEDNPILLSKKIILDERLEIGDNQHLTKIKEQMAGIEDNIYIYMEGNEQFHGLESCEKANKLVQDRVKKILELGLSPIETLMVTYDLVRGRTYQLECKNENSSKSRDLNEILEGSAIVCEGFSKYLNVLLKKMGYKCDLVRLLGTGKNGHMRNIVYVKDEKYSIDGAYYFDATWNCQDIEDSNLYLNDYSYFARTRKSLDNRKYFEKGFSIYNNDIEYYKEKLSHKPSELDFNELNEIISSINFMSKLIKNERLIPNDVYLKNNIDDIPYITEKIIQALEEVVPKFDKPIPKEKLVEILCNARLAEYKINPDLYKCNAKQMYITAATSEWPIDVPKEKRILAQIFGHEINEAAYFIENNKETLKKLETNRLVYLLKKKINEKKM